MGSNSKFAEKGFMNWLKGALAVNFTKEGLEDFVTDEMVQLQKDLLALVCSNKGLPLGTTCSSCTTASLLQCPTPNFCSNGRRCPMHDPRKNQTQHCLSKLCDGIRKGISNEHTLARPSWKNTDARGWCSNSFEIAKCYMPVEGYSDVQSYSDTDFNGILAVIIYNKRFKNKMLANYKAKCEKARDVGRVIRHSADLSIPDAELTQHIDSLVDLLSDSKCLTTYQKAQEAISKLKQLEANTLTITTEDIAAVVGNYIRETVEQGRQNIIAEADGHKTEIKNESKTVVDMLSEVRQLLHECKTLTVANFDDLLANKIKTILNGHSIYEKRETREVQTMAEIGRDQNEEKTILNNDFEEDVPQPGLISKTYSCFRRKRPHDSLKEDLLIFYRQRHSTISVSPLIEEHGLPLVDFYVPPKLTSIDIQSSYHQGPLGRTPVDSYKDLILSKDKPYRNIYITAKAGVGKTSFSKRICIAWCQAHAPEKPFKGRFSDKEIDTLKRFDYLFMIPLRETNKGECNVEDMIYSLVKSELSDRYTKTLIEEILHNKRCLIVLDGLDEWSHPEECGRKDDKVPHRKCREKCTFLTTSRPWKLNDVRIGTGFIDMHVEICELDELTYKGLVSVAVSLLNKRNIYDKPKSAGDFHDQIAALKLGNLQYIPYILLQLICLWYDGRPVGKSRCEIFSNIIELTFLREKSKYAYKDINTELGIDNIPGCFINNACCVSQYGLLQSLAKLAFETLFSPAQESALVFEEDVTRKYLSPENISRCLKIGLLSQNKDYSCVSQRRSTFTFQHKSVQEFFSALYIQSHMDEDNSQTLLTNVCKSVSAIADMSNVFIFVGGFNANAAEKISFLFKQIVSDDDMMSHYRKQLKGYFINSEFSRGLELRHSFQAMFVEIAQEIVMNKQCLPHILLEDITIDRRNKSKSLVDNINILTEKNKNNIKTLCIREIESPEKFGCILYNLKLQDVKALQKLVIWADPPQKDLLFLLEGSNHTLECVSLDFRSFIKGELIQSYPEMAPESIRTITQMDCLESFSLEYVRLKHTDLELLCAYLSGRVRMTQICLLFIKCIDHGESCCGHNLDLSRHQRLDGIALDKVAITELNINTESLEECGIGRLPFSVRDSWLTSLPNGGNFQTLTCIGFSVVDFPAVSTTLPRLKHLRYLSFFDANFAESALCLSQNLETLEVVWFLRISVKSKALRRFVESIHTLKQPVQVILEACSNTSGQEHKAVMNSIRKSSKYCVLVDKVNDRKQREFSFKSMKKKTR